MAVDERRRKALHDALEQRIGPEEASTLMELLPPVGWADVARKDDLRQLELRLEAKIDGLRAELTGRMVGFEGALTGKVDRLQGELKAQIFRTVLAVNIPSILGAVALSFAAVRLA